MRRLRSLYSRSLTSALRGGGALGRALRREDVIVSVAFVGGALSVAAGFGLVYLPLGFIVGGLTSSVCALSYARAKGS